MSDKRLQMEEAKRIMEQKPHKLGQIMAITASDLRALPFYSFLFLYTPHLAEQPIRVISHTDRLIRANGAGHVIKTRATDTQRWPGHRLSDWYVRY